MKLKARILFTSFLFLLIAGTLSAQTGIAETLIRTHSAYAVFAPAKEIIPIFSDGQLSPILFDDKDHKGVQKIIGHLVSDLEQVTGQQPKLLQAMSNQRQASLILVGTLGKSKWIKQLVETKKLKVEKLEGQWEKFYIATIEQPFPNVEQAVVIVGADKRGTIYGVYDLCEKIGVSPWNWWADVPVVKRDFIGIHPGLYTDGVPKVKYRGIFINDEAPALSGWVHERYGGFNHKFYEKVFELILRLKGNYLWPAMWGRAIYDDDPLSPPLADEMGVVIGTSHHEPLMRAHVEWDRYGKGEWNYERNPEVLQEFWREGIRRMGANESIVTIGMRGDGDKPMSDAANIALLENIIKDQREIIVKETGKAITATPQIWALYKEVQEYYDKGMRAPDDVILLLCDDNWGNIRKLPKPGNKIHPGGYGIYYHFDYVGGPRNYKWINTNNIPRIWEQMHLAWEHGVDQIWIVNVGDIKPMELPTSFFLDMAWNPELMDHGKMVEYTTNWAAQQFDGFQTKKTVHLLDTYSKFNSRRKPELLNIPSYSLTQYDEAQRIVEDYQKLERDAYEILHSIPTDYFDSFYQLVYFPIAASANLNALYLAHNLNQWYAEQGRASTNKWAEKVRQHFRRDSLLTYYHNKILADGKWNHFMDQTHIGYTYWQQPRYNTMPEVKELPLKTNGNLGVWLPLQPKALRADSFYHLPVLDPNLQSTTFIELFNTGQWPLDFALSCNKPWVELTSFSGKVVAELRIPVAVNWDLLGKQEDTAIITIHSADGKAQKVELTAKKPTYPVGFKGYVESNGVISIKAEEGFQTQPGNGLDWQVIHGIGRVGDGVRAFPGTIQIKPDALSADSPHFHYDFFTEEGGSFDIELWISPTLDFYDKGGLLTAVSLDDQKPKVLNVHDPEKGFNWYRVVSDQVNVVQTNLEIPAGQHQLKIWHLDPGIVYERIIIKRKGLVEDTYLGPPKSLKQ